MNNILFLVEGKKTEPNIIKNLCKTILGYGDIQIETDISKNLEINIKDKINIYIKWIEDGSISVLNNKLDTEEFSDGINISAYYEINKNIEFSMEFIIIDADMKDHMKNGNKKDLIISLDKKIKNMDNTHLLISSPSIESLFDNQDKYSYNNQKSYKEIVESITSGKWGKEIKDGKSIDKYLLMNIEKFNKMPYDDQRMFSTNNYNENNKEIYIRNTLFHVICEYYFIYNDDNKLIEIINSSSDY